MTAALVVNTEMEEKLPPMQLLVEALTDTALMNDVTMKMVTLWDLAAEDDVTSRREQVVQLRPTLARMCA